VLFAVLAAIVGALVGVVIPLFPLLCIAFVVWVVLKSTRAVVA